MKPTNQPIPKGLTDQEMNRFLEMIVKANDQQLRSMIHTAEANLYRREQYSVESYGEMMTQEEFDDIIARVDAVVAGRVF